MALPEWAAWVGVGGGILTAFVAALRVKPESKKLDRDGAAAVLTAGAAIIKGTETDRIETQRRLAELEQWRRTVEARLRRHSQWDQRMVHEARTQGLVVDDPPPLWDSED